MRVRLKHDVLARELARRNLSQNHWAAKLGVSRSFLSMLVNGKRPYPGTRTREKLLEGLALEFDDLFEVELVRDRLKRALARRMPRIRFTDHPRGDGLMTSLAQDFARAFRTLARNPAFTLLCCLVLALGIGANTAIFSVVDAVLLKPLPYPNASDLVQIFSTRKDPSLASGFKVMSYPDFRDVESDNGVLGDVAAVTYGHFTWTGTERPERLFGARVSSELFSLLGVWPVEGRAFSPQEEEPEADRVVILSHRLWQRGFGGDPDRIGRTLELDEESYTVVGVMPQGFQMPLELVSTRQVDVLVPIAPYAASLGRGIRRFSVYGRLKPGVTLEEAREPLALLGERLAAAYPESNEDQALAVTALAETVVGRSRGLLSLFGGVAALLLLIASANVANLVLSRNAGRARELAIRTALGAGRLRLASELLAESVVLGLAGALPGLFVALALQRLLVAHLASDLPRLDEVGLDLRVLAFTLGLAVSTGVLFGLLPAWLTSRTRSGSALREAAPASGAVAGGRRWRGALAVFEIALALVVLIGASLLANSLWRLGNVEPGFTADDVLVTELRLASGRYGDDAVTEAFYRRLLDEIGTLPGLASAGLVNLLPLDGGFSCDTFAVEDRPEDWQPCAEFRVSTPGYFRSMGIPLVRGRAFTPEDDREGAPVALVNETLARRLWPGGDPLGKKLKYGSRSSSGDWHTIVGVVADTRQLALAEETAPEFHLPLGQAAWVPRSVHVVMRGPATPAALSETLRERVRTLDADLPLAGVTTMEQVVRDSIARPRSRALLLAAFALSALTLVVAGIYAVMAYSVTQKTHEIGIRLALGARRGDVVGLILRQGLGLTLAGLALGVLGSLALTRVLSNLLYGVTPTDPATFVVASLLFSGVALLASYLPARSAAAVDPLQSLRDE